MEELPTIHIELRWFSLTATTVFRITQFLLCWSQFWETFATEEDCKTIILNNKEIEVANKPVYYKNCFNARVICIQDLFFSLNSTDSYNQLFKNIILGKTNTLKWAGLLRSIPLSLRSNDRYPSMHKLTNNRCV